MPKHHSILLGIVFFAALSLPAARAMERIEVLGHRGARAAYPESSLPAFQYAIEAGVDDLESDLHLTSDDQLVLSHDGYINPDHCLDASGETPRQKRLIRQMTLAEVKQYDCGSLPNPGFPGQRRVPGSRILALKELLAWLAGSPDPRAGKVGVLLEIKVPLSELGADPRPVATLPPGRYAERVARTIAESGARNPFSFACVDPRYSTAASTRARDLGVQVRTGTLYPDYRWLSPVLIQSIHFLGFRVMPWTPNSPDEWQRLIEWGVDGIITDDPGGLIRFLEERRRGIRP